MYIESLKTCIQGLVRTKLAIKRVQYLSIGITIGFGSGLLADILRPPLNLVSVGQVLWYEIMIVATLLIILLCLRGWPNADLLNTAECLLKDFITHGLTHGWNVQEIEALELLLKIPIKHNKDILALLYDADKKLRTSIEVRDIAVLQKIISPTQVAAAS